MSRKILNFFQMSLVFFVISSCGFEVIYDEKKTGISYEEELASIKIQKDTGRLSQELRNSLHDLFNPGGLKVEPKYILILNLSNYTTSTFTTSLGASGRNRVVVDIRYELISLENGKIVAEGTTNVGDNYDVQDNRFGTYTADEYTLLNVTKIAAQNIRNLLVNDIIEMKKDNKERFKKIIEEPLIEPKTGSKKTPKHN